MASAAIAIVIIICGRKDKKLTILNSYPLFKALQKQAYIFDYPTNSIFNSMKKLDHLAKLLLLLSAAAIIFYIWNRGWGADYNFW